jgi:hypothetical protein
LDTALVLELGLSRCKKGLSRTAPTTKTRGDENAAPAGLRPRSCNLPAAAHPMLPGCAARVRPCNGRACRWVAHRSDPPARRGAQRPRHLLTVAGRIPTRVATAGVAQPLGHQEHRHAQGQVLLGLTRRQPRPQHRAPAHHFRRFRAGMIKSANLCNWILDRAMSCFHRKLVSKRGRRQFQHLHRVKPRIFIYTHGNDLSRSFTCFVKKHCQRIDSEE